MFVTTGKSLQSTEAPTSSSERVSSIESRMTEPVVKGGKLLFYAERVGLREVPRNLACEARVAIRRDPS